MKIAIVYNRASKRVINLFGVANQEKLGLKTIARISEGLRKGGHQVKAFEGDKDLVENLEHFMPRVVKGELPGLVFNLSYGIQGQARYTHVPSILEMVGIPYVGSGPLAHSLALDKVVAKMIFRQKEIPTPEYAVMESRDAPLPDLAYPLIVKPKNEAVSFGIRIVNDEEELRAGADAIFDRFGQAVLVEQYIAGREVNVGLIGNNPPEAFPPVELIFGTSGPAIYTYEDKTRRSGREIGWECPARFEPAILDKAVTLAKRAFDALGCYDCARVDMRVDAEGHLYVLEINSLPSLGEHGSYTIGAQHAGLSFDKLVCRLVEVASARYFGTPAPAEIHPRAGDVEQKIFSYLLRRRDDIESRVNTWTQIPSRSNDPIGIQQASLRLSKFCDEVKLKPVADLTDGKAVWTWESRAGLNDGILLIGHLDVAQPHTAASHAFRTDPERLYGEGIGTSRAPLVSMQFALRALRHIRRLRMIPLGLLYYSDEGRDCRYSHDLIVQAATRAREVLILRPGHPENNVVIQRRGLRRYRFTASASPRRLGKPFRRKSLFSWTSSCLEKMTHLTSTTDRLAVAPIDVRTESFPMLLPHRVTGMIHLSYLDTSTADKADEALRLMAKNKDYQFSLELVSDRPPMRKSKRNERLYSEIKKLADEWEIPIDKETSLNPSVAGLVPSTKAALCGIGPVAQDVGTPKEAVLRISLTQRTLLLALLLARRAGKSDGG